MVLIRPQSTYDLKEVSVYGALKVTSASPKRLTVPEAFDFAQEQSKLLGVPAHLQTLGQALVTRVEFYNDNKTSKKGLDNSDHYQRTSTVSLRLKNDGSFKVDAPYVVAFADLPLDEKSRSLVQKGYDANSNGKELILPVKDAFICDLIAQAKDTGRVAPAHSEKSLVLATAQKGGKSAYGQNQNVIAVFGNAELAELNASYLSERGYKEGFIWDYTTKELENELEGKEDSAIVRAVGLGGVNCSIIYGVNANVNFVSYGRARSIVHVGAQKSSNSR